MGPKAKLNLFRGEIPASCFMGRGRELQTIQSAVENGRHHLFIGPRGVGKTTLFGQGSDALRRESMPGNQWVIPVRLDEDFRNLADAGDFAINVLRHIGMELRTLKILDRDLQAGCEREANRILGKPTRRLDDAGAVDALEGLAGSMAEIFNHVTNNITISQKELGPFRLAIFVENWDDFLERILEDEKEGQHILDLFQATNSVLITSSTTRPPELDDPDHVFYRRFEITEIKPFDKETSRRFLQELAHYHGNRVFADEVVSKPEIIEILYQLTRGNPRLLYMFFRIAQEADAREIEEGIANLLVEITPYYQNLINKRELKGVKRKVLIQMVRNDVAETPTTLANQLGIPVNKINSAIQWLTHHNVVEPFGSKEGRSQRYIVKDHFFRIWMQVNQTASSRSYLDSLIRFYKSWHRQEGNKDRRVMDELSSDGRLELGDEDRINDLMDRLAGDKSDLLEEIGPEVRQHLYSNNTEKLKELFASVENRQPPPGQRELDKLAVFKAISFFQAREFETVMVTLNDLFEQQREVSEPLWWLYSRTLFLNFENIDTITAFNERWLRQWPDSIEARYHQGVILMLSNRHEEADRAFDACMGMEETSWGVRKPVIMSNRGLALLLRDKPDEARVRCRNALELGNGEEIPHVHRNLACVAIHQGEEETARIHLRKTIDCLRNSRDGRDLDLYVFLLFDKLDDQSSLVDDCIEVVIALARVTSHRINRNRFRELLNKLLREGKTRIAKRLVTVLQEEIPQTAQLLKPYDRAFKWAALPNNKERQAFMRQLFPEDRRAVELIAELIS